MLDFICCPGFKCFATFKAWICCRSQEQDENKEKKRIITFAKLPDGINIKFLFINHDIGNSINFVFNSNQDIITAHSDNIGKLFNKKADKLVGLNLRDLTKYVPAGIVDMIGIILKSVETDGVMRGCLIYIDGVCHVCCGFPIIDTERRVISVLLIKKEMIEGLANADEILTGHASTIRPLALTESEYAQPTSLFRPAERTSEFHLHGNEFRSSRNRSPDPCIAGKDEVD